MPSPIGAAGVHFGFAESAGARRIAPRAIAGGALIAPLGAAIVPCACKTVEESVSASMETTVRTGDI